MKSSIALVLVLLGFVAVATAGKGKGGKGGQHEKMKKMLQCQGKDGNFDYFKNPDIYKGCLTPKKGEEQEEEVDRKKRDTEEGHGHGKMDPAKMRVMQICMWKNMEICHDGKIDQEKYIKINEDVYKDHKEVADGLTKALKESDCFKDDKITGLSEDNQCESYQPFITCTMKVFQEYCHPK